MSWDIRFFALTSGFCHEFEKINSKTVPANRTFRSKIRNLPHDLGTNRRKNGNIWNVRTSFPNL